MLSTSEISKPDLEDDIAITEQRSMKIKYIIYSEKANKVDASFSEF